MATPWKHDVFIKETSFLIDNLDADIIVRECSAADMIVRPQARKLEGITDEAKRVEKLLQYIEGGDEASFHTFCEIIRTKMAKPTFKTVLQRFNKIDKFAQEHAGDRSELNPTHEPAQAAHSQAAAASPGEEPNQMVVPTNGHKELCLVTDLEDLADDLKDNLTDNLRRKFAKKIAVLHDKEMVKTYETVIRDYIRDNDIRGAEDVSNVHGVLHWAHSRDPCPTVDQIYACLTDKRVCPQNAVKFLEILSQEDLCDE